MARLTQSARDFFRRRGLVFQGGDIPDDVLRSMVKEAAMAEAEEAACMFCNTRNPGGFPLHTPDGKVHTVHWHSVLNGDPAPVVVLPDGELSTATKFLAGVPLPKSLLATGEQVCCHGCFHDHFIGDNDAIPS